MRIWLNERVVERCKDQSSPNYRKITKQYTKTIHSFNSDVIPRVGEIFYLDENTAYDVVNVIYSFSNAMNQFRSVTLEVIPHVSKHVYSVGGYSYEEDWPLVMDIEATQDWLDEDASLEDTEEN